MNYKKGKVFKGRESAVKKKLLAENLVLGKVTLLRETESISKLLSADQVIPCWLIKGYIPGGQLYIKS